MSLTSRGADPVQDIPQAQRDLAFAEHRMAELKEQVGIMNRAGEPIPERMSREKLALHKEIQGLQDYLED